MPIHDSETVNPQPNPLRHAQPLLERTILERASVYVTATALRASGGTM